MNVVYAIPTADAAKAAITLAAWRAMGYLTAAAIDPGAPSLDADLVLPLDEYRGYADACNCLTAVLSDADVIVFGGDDVFPDPSKDADEIAREFRDYFPDLCGVMQPTGDPFGAHHECCQSPWVGRGFIERTYGGNGPFWPGYLHFYADTELHDVAARMGRLWKRSDIVQFHDNWQRSGNRPRPPYLEKAASDNANAKRLFTQRKAAGFPGSLKRLEPANA